MQTFDADAYGPVLSPLLIPRLMPLDGGRPNRTLRPQLEALSDLRFLDQPIQDRDMARACVAGLWLYHDFLDESHEISQGLHTPEGSFWHAVMHRREPDYSNSKYWWRQAGKHPVFTDLARAAASLGYGEASTWDPFGFVDACQRALGKGDQEEELCQRVQRAEWELLFDWCWRQAAS